MLLRACRTCHILSKPPHDPGLYGCTSLALSRAVLCRTLQLRLERFTLFWIRESVVIEQGATLMLGSGAHIYGAVDWVAMAMSADETQDLTRPEVRLAAWSHPNRIQEGPLHTHHMYTFTTS